MASAVLSWVQSVGVMPVRAGWVQALESRRGRREGAAGGPGVVAGGAMGVGCRVVRWPAPEDPDTSEDTELDGRDLIADRLTDEVEWLRRCAGWLHHLHVQTYPPVVNLRPARDWPDTTPVVADLPRIQTILERIATDVDELARARRVEELDIAAVRPDRRAEQRRRAAEDDLDFRQFGTRNNLAMSSTLQLERAWDAWQAERHRRGEIDQRPGYSDNPFRPH